MPEKLDFTFDAGEKVKVPLVDAELAELRDKTIASLRTGVDEATQRLFSPETSSTTREEAERILKIQIGNLAQVIGWDKAERYGKEAKERFATKEDAVENSGASGAFSRTNRVLRSFFSSF